MAIKAQSSNQVTKITVKQSRQNLPIELGQSAQHFNNLSELWATSPNIVENKDYSSKYYAEKSNQSALNAQSFAQSTQDSYNNFQQSVEGALSNIDSSVQGAITTIDTKSDEAIETINNTVGSAVENIDIEANKQIDNIERTGFYMRDDKLYFINSEGEEEEFSSGSGFNLFDTKISDHILTDKEALGWALQGTYVYKNGGTDRTGYPDFYNKCLEEYENSEAQIVTEPWTQPVATGEITAIDGGDMVITSSEGVEDSYYPHLAFDGDYSSSSSMWSAYPNTEAWWQIKFPYKIKITGLTFYQKISGASHFTKDARFYTSSDMNTPIGDSFVGTSSNFAVTEIQNIPAEGIITDTIYLNITSSYNGGVGMGDLKITAEKVIDGIRNNPNGHKFYPISLKPQIDEIYNTYGIADFYGIDEENERVFLPRNKYFHQLTADVSRVNQMVEAGLPNIKGSFGFTDEDGAGALTGYAFAPNDSLISGCFTRGSVTKKALNPTGSGTVNGADVLFDASCSNPIYNNSTTVQPPSSLKLLYYCVGNTEVTQAITNVTEVTTSENDTIPLFTGLYFDFKPNNVSWLKAGEQQNGGGVYKTCYDTLVEIVNGINNYDLKVINQVDMLSGVIYDEYWILDQDNLTFRTPLTIATKSLSGAVAGNGMVLGLDKNAISNTNSFSQLGAKASGNNDYVDVIVTNENIQAGYPIGVHTDPTKSGIIAQQSNAQLYFKVANAVQNLELLNVGKVLEGLSNKLDRGNKQEIVSWGMPDYSAGINKGLSFTSDGYYLMYVTGYWSTSASGSKGISVFINGTQFNMGLNYGEGVQYCFYLSPNDVVQITYTTSTASATLYPLKGAK